MSLWVIGSRENPYIGSMTLNEKQPPTDGVNRQRHLRQDSDRTDHLQDASHKLLIPIRSLGDSHRGEIAKHLLELDAHDRYLRFGFVASDEHIDRYVAGLDFERDEVLGITNRKLSLIAIAHLAFFPEKTETPCAEFGVSVAKSVRGRGFGALLFERAAMDARNKGVSFLFIHALSENTAMLRIARNAGAVIERMGSDSEAFLRLAPASLGSRMTEIVEDHYAQIDYRLKAQSKQFLNVLSAIKSLNHTWCGSRRRPEA